MDYRHIYGFALFKLILFSTVFVNSLFFAPAIKTVEPVNEVPVYKATHCFPTKGGNAQNANYAEFDAKTKTLRMRIRVESQEISFKDNAPVILIFGTDSQMSEAGQIKKLAVKPFTVDNVKGVSELQIETTLNWLNKDYGTQNLYVTATVSADVTGKGGSVKSATIPVLTAH